MSGRDLFADDEDFATSGGVDLFADGQGGPSSIESQIGNKKSYAQLAMSLLSAIAPQVTEGYYGATDAFKSAIKGAGQFGESISNSPAYLARSLGQQMGIPEQTINRNFPTNEVNWNELLNLEPNTLNELASASVKYGPLGVVNIPGMNPEALNYGGRIAEQGLKGLIGGAFMEQNPIQNAPLQAILGSGIQGGGEALGNAAGLLLKNPRVQNVFNNSISKFIEKRAQQNKARSPEETRALMESQYTTPDGELIQADIGTLTGEPVTSMLYSGAALTPFSGGSARQNLVQKQLNQVEDSEMDKAITLAEKLYKNEERNASNVAGELGQEKSILEGFIDKEKSSIYQLEEDVLKAPEILNMLPAEMIGKEGSMLSPSELTSVQAKNLEQIYKAKKQEANQLYKNLNDRDINIAVDKKQDFPNLEQVRDRNLERMEDSVMTFNQTELPRQVTEQLQKVMTFLRKSPEGQINVPSIVQKIQDLGKISAQLKSAGYRNEARMIKEFDDALEQDFHNVLINKGYNDLSSEFKQATSFYKNNIVPFWNSREISNAVEFGHIPEAGKLARELYRPDNGIIYEMLDPAMRKLTAFERITSGKGNAEGESALNASSIATRIAGLNRDEANLMAKDIPQEFNYLSGLSNKLNDMRLKKMSAEQIEKQISKIESQIEKIPKSDRSKIASLQMEKLKLQEARKTSAPKSAVNSKLAKALLTTMATAGAIYSPSLAAKSAPLMLPIIGAARGLEKTLTSPSLINRYTSGIDLPTGLTEEELFMQKLRQSLGQSRAGSNGENY